VITDKTLWSGVLAESVTTLYSVGSGKRSVVNLWRMFNQANADVNINLFATISGNQIPLAKILFKSGYSLDVLDEEQQLKLTAGDSISGQCSLPNSVNGVIQGTEESPV